MPILYTIDSIGISLGVMEGDFVKIRFGYVAIALNVKDCSPSRAVTAANLGKIEEIDARLIKLRKVAEENLSNTLRILRYNAAHDIKLYRLTSKLVPLATHPYAEGWDYTEDLKESFRQVGDFIKGNGMRVSAHPDHFTLLNSPREEVLEGSLKDLAYHENIFDAMGLDNSSKLVLHIGGLYNDRYTSQKRFIDNFILLREDIKERITLENDDKVYNAEEVLSICQTLNLPMVLDIHHDRCNPGSRDIGEYLGPIFDTWRGQGIPPKIHLSSPKNEKDIRSHADYIEKEDFIVFLHKAEKLRIDFDVMIEAKQKDLALHKLMEELKYEEGIKIVNGAEILV